MARLKVKIDKDQDDKFLIWIEDDEMNSVTLVVSAERKETAKQEAVEILSNLIMQAAVL